MMGSGLRRILFCCWSVLRSNGSDKIKSSNQLSVQQSAFSVASNSQLFIVPRIDFDTDVDLVVCLSLPQHHATVYCERGNASVLVISTSFPSMQGLHYVAQIEYRLNDGSVSTYQMTPYYIKELAPGPPGRQIDESSESLLRTATDRSTESDCFVYGEAPAYGSIMESDQTVAFRFQADDTKYQLINFSIEGMIAGDLSSSMYGIDSPVQWVG